MAAFRLAVHPRSAYGSTIHTCSHFVSTEYRLIYVNCIALNDIHSSGMMLLLFAITDDNGQLLSSMYLAQ